MTILDNILGAPWRQFFQITEVPFKLKTMAFLKRSVIETAEHNKLVSGIDFKRQLGWFSFACIGWGTMVATGVFTLMPKVYATITGPAILLSVMIASVANISAGLLTSEFANEYPLVGGAFVYVLNTFGEVPAVLCASFMLLGYIYAGSAVVRNFSLFFSVILDQKENIFQKSVGFQRSEVDYLAPIVIAILSFIALWSTKAFNRTNIALQILHLVTVVGTIISAFAMADLDNLSPFFPSHTSLSIDSTESGSRNVLKSASNVFFLFVGFDVIALAAEEAKNEKAVPIGIISSVFVVALSYTLMTLGMILLYPASRLYSEYYKRVAECSEIQCLNPPMLGGGFIYAFASKNMEWAKYIAALAALLGILSCAGLNCFAVSRTITVLSREGMLPSIGAYVSPYTFTPTVAIAVAGLVIGFVSCFNDFEALSRMTSIGILITYWFVAISYIFKRYATNLDSIFDEDGAKDRHLLIPFQPNHLSGYLSSRARKALVLFYIFIFTMCPIGFTIYWNEEDGSWALIFTVVLWFVSTLMLQLTLPISYVPQGFCLPWYIVPWVPSIAIWTTVMLIGGFDVNQNDYIKIFVTIAIGFGAYIFYGLHVNYWRFFGAAD